MNKKRFYALDEARGFAICAMILAHFGPGLYERIGLSGITLEILQFIGRLATPGFILIFGFTLGIAYLPKSISSPHKTRMILLSRSYKVFLCALIISIPSIVTMGYQDYWVGATDHSYFDYFLSTYSVLIFYTFAIFISAFLIHPISQFPVILPITLGAGFVFIGTILGYEIWAASLESLRLIFVSGKYGVLVSLGCALLFLPIGHYLKQESFSDHAVKVVLPLIGISIIFLSLSCGRLVGWRSLSDLTLSYVAPPQIWYLALVGGILCLLISFFASVKLPVVSRFLSLTGQMPLRIYVAHAFVLPCVTLFKSDFVGISGALSISIPLVIFFIYWGWVVIHRYKTGDNKN